MSDSDVDGLDIEASLDKFEEQLLVAIAQQFPYAWI
jgi:hypothetical protein